MTVPATDRQLNVPPIRVWRSPPAAAFTRGAIVSTGVALMAAAFAPELRHWMLIPVILTGALTWPELVEWTKYRDALFSPLHILFSFGFYFFFMAPLLHVIWNYWLPYVRPPPDWRPWLGRAAAINVVGLVLLRCSLRVAGSLKAKVIPAPRRFVISRFRPIALWLMLLTGAIQLSLFARAGGITGYSDAVTGGRTPFSGLGWLLAIGESFPLISLVTLAVFLATRRVRISAPLRLALFGSFIVAQVLLAGLRGSRGNVIWAVFIGLGVMNFFVHPLRRRTLLAVGLAGLVFMYAYGFYKALGADAVHALRRNSDLGELERTSGRTVPTLLLGDLGRSDVQAYELYRLALPSRSHELAWGRTYISGIASLVPSFILPSRPAGKLQYGTDLLFDQDTFATSDFRASNIYGLLGEGLLNFPFPIVVLVFPFLGIVLSGLQTRAESLTEGDPRLILVPVGAVVGVLLLSSDLGNAAFAAVQYGLVVAILVLSTSARARSTLQNPLI